MCASCCVCATQLVFADRLTHSCSLPQWDGRRRKTELSLRVCLCVKVSKQYQDRWGPEIDRTVDESETNSLGTRWTCFTKTESGDESL